MIKLIVIGASNPAIIRLVDDINSHNKDEIEILGFLDNNKNKEKNFFGSEILGNFDRIKKFDKKKVYLINTIASSCTLRKKTTEYFTKKKYKFTNIIHPTVNLGHVEIGNGNVIYENTLIQPFVKIGNHNIISSNSGVAHETVIGNFVFVGPSSYLCGRVRIKDNVFLGAGTRVLPDVKIDTNVNISAGSIVNKNLSSNKKVFVTQGRWIIK